MRGRVALRKVAGSHQHLGLTAMKCGTSVRAYMFGLKIDLLSASSSFVSSTARSL